MIEIEKTYKITFTEEQLHELYTFLDRNDDKLKGTGLNAILKELEGIFDVSYYSRKQK